MEPMQQRREGIAGSNPRWAILVASALLGLLVAAPGAGAVEPNEDFATATGPLVAGTPFKASLETINDIDFQFFYLPETTQLSVTTINETTKRGGAADRGRTIVSSLLRGRKGKLPLPLAGTERTLAPGKRATVKISLVPGKYFIPIGRASNGATPEANVPFRIEIGPVGSTTSSFEIFERRCRDAQSKVSRIKSSKQRTAERLAKAKRGDAPDSKVRALEQKLRSKRAKIAEAQRLKRIVCSVPR